MATITYHFPQGPAVGVRLEPGETVLTGLLRHGIAVPNSCRAGACQTCLMQATDGVVPAAAQRGLKDAARARGLFMACAAVPEGDLAVRFADDAVNRARVIVRSIEHVGANVARVRLEAGERFDYFPGQFVNVVRPADGLIRSYSLASLNAADDAPGDGHLELHVRKIAGGQMSKWLHDDVRPGDEVELRGPAGDCFYVPGRPEQPIVLIGTGTGLAPLWAIARDALRRGHVGPVRLYHGALNAGGLYYRDELMRLATAHANFAYVPCVRDGEGGAADGLRVGGIDAVVLSDLPKLAGWRIFLCGDPTLVNALRKRVYVAGAKLGDIHADAFVTRGART